MAYFKDDWSAIPMFLVFIGLITVLGMSTVLFGTPSSRIPGLVKK